jgi:phage terminase large subunit GpA-like protein
MGYMETIKCEKCGHEDKREHIDPEDVDGEGSTTMLSKKTEKTIHVKDSEYRKFSDKKKSDLKSSFKIGEIKCPKCGEKKYKKIGEVEF